MLELLGMLAIIPGGTLLVIGIEYARSKYNEK